ncbi:LacI family DNA-binding transcriptional regulator [Shewanella sp. KX20019]|uniref:LacI family DNA-binding transcriptional regulator n=1 Tax=Shewanella sp. KX20019 TaxID=2803864 RepID=UPI0019263FC1|nr:LacI family DNA-binding transcriptional regulator [Shewanella sp. KX20019]QQX81849.1 LacI family DNA-binding transcriptional regulator [Shewanella sp. KX20019]
MATIYDVSVLAGVSLATVSRVMNKNAKVSEKTLKKVQDAMDQLGYRPNAIAQSLASNRSNSVGILVSELHGPFYGSMLSGIEAELRVAQKHAIIAAGHSEEALEKEGIEFLISRRCDALILHVEAVSDDYLIDLVKKEVPIVLINRFIPSIANNCISLNNELGGYIAAKAMIEQGHREIAYISGPNWKMDACDRLQGHQRALKEFNITYNPKLTYEGDYQEGGGSDGLAYLLENDFPFSALVCANDEMAAGAMNLAREKKVAIPAELSIIGFDNIILAQYIYPKLSTIDYPVKQMGQMAARWILKNTFKKPELEVKNVFEPKLIKRDSIISHH